jgi:hypothetical protein
MPAYAVDHRSLKGLTACSREDRDGDGLNGRQETGRDQIGNAMPIDGSAVTQE